MYGIYLQAGNHITCSIQQRGNAITFVEKGGEGINNLHDDPIVISMEVAHFKVQKMLVDSGSSVDIILLDVLRKMDLDVTVPSPTPLRGFEGSKVSPLGPIDLLTSLGSEPIWRTIMLKYLVVDEPFTYNIVLGRGSLNKLQAIVSTFHLKMKISTKHKTGEVKGD